MTRRPVLAPVVRLFGRTGGRRLWLGAGLATATALAGMALIGLSGWFITATALAGLSAGAALSFNVFLPGAGIRLLALMRTAGRYGERIVTHDATLAVLAALRERLFRGWAEAPAARMLQRRPARLLFRLTHDIDALEPVYLRWLVPAVTASGAAMLAGVVVGVQDWRLGLILLVWLGVFGAAMGVAVARRARLPAMRRARALEQLRAQAIDLVAGQTDLAMAGRLQAQCDTLCRTDARLARADDALNRLEVRAGWTTALAGHLTVAGMLLAVGLLAEQGTLRAPAAALVLLVALVAFEPIGALRRGAIEAGRCWLAMRRVAPRLQAEAPEGSAAPAAARCDAKALQLLSVDVTHLGAPAPALRRITLHIGVGERVALVGPSGAGKSTLMAAIAGEIPVSAGRLDAHPCTWLTQRTELFQDSLRDNLRLADPAASDERLWSALRASGLARDVRALTGALDSRLGEGGLGLSGGQARRLALARLLLHPSEFWLLDEPTEGLDGATAADVMSRLAQHAGHRTLLIATHWRREAERADRLLVMADGRIAADHRRGTAGFQAVMNTLRA